MPSVYHIFNPLSVAWCNDRYGTWVHLSPNHDKTPHINGVWIYSFPTRTSLIAITLLAGTGLILGLRPGNKRRHYKVTPSLNGWAQI